MEKNNIKGLYRRIRKIWLKGQIGRERLRSRDVCMYWVGGGIRFRLYTCLTLTVRVRQVCVCIIGDERLERIHLIPNLSSAAASFKHTHTHTHTHSVGRLLASLLTSAWPLSVPSYLSVSHRKSNWQHSSALAQSSCPVHHPTVTLRGWGFPPSALLKYYRPSCDDYWRVTQQSQAAVRRRPLQSVEMS